MATRKRKRVVLRKRKAVTQRRNAASTGKLIPAKVRVSKDGTVRVFVNPRHLNPNDDFLKSRVVTQSNLVKQAKAQYDHYKRYGTAAEKKYFARQLKLTVSGLRAAKKAR
jgi:hypothetical protein